MRRTLTVGRRGFTLIELLCVGGCAALLMAVTVPAVEKSRSDARSNQCRNNLKQFGLALHNYHDIFRTFPPGWVAEHHLPGKCFGYGWLRGILPQMEESALYSRIGFHKPMPEANKLLQKRIAGFRCPMDPTPDINPLRGDYGTANYSGNYGFAIPAKDAGGTEPGLLRQWLPSARTLNWPGQRGAPNSTNGIFYVNSKVGIRDIIDGTSNTLLVGERSAKGAAGIWPGVRRNELADDQVTDCSPGNEINSGATSFSSYHTGGAHFVFCDGSARFISDKIDSKPGIVVKRGTLMGQGVFQAISSRNGNEVVGKF